MVSPLGSFFLLPEGKILNVLIKKEVTSLMKLPLFYFIEIE